MKVYDRIFQKGMATGLHLMKIKQPVKIEGKDSAKRVAQILCFQNRVRPMIVSGPRVSKTAFFRSLVEGLKDYALFDEVQPDPTIAQIEKMVLFYREHHCDCLIAIGGGSNIDAMKVCAARIANPEKRVEMMKGTLKVRKKLTLMIAVPTTAGTGSECTIAAVVRNEKSGHKYSLNDPVLCPDYAILDPLGSLSMPAQVTAHTGMDALTHAIEAYLNTPYHQKETAAYCQEAVGMIFANVLRAYRHPEDIEARAQMLEASYLAGLAFTVACVGNVHACAHAIGGLYHVPHGKANAILLPLVLERYGSKVEKPLAELAHVIGINEKDPRTCAHLFIERIRYLNEAMSIPSTFDHIQKKDLETMAEWCVKEANPLYPVPVIFDKKDFVAILSKAGALY